MPIFLSHLSFRADAMGHVEKCLSGFSIIVCSFQSCGLMVLGDYNPSCNVISYNLLLIFLRYLFMLGLSFVLLNYIWGYNKQNNVQHNCLVTIHWLWVFHSLYWLIFSCTCLHTFCTNCG
jgi:hypothetical protein